MHWTLTPTTDGQHIYRLPSYNRGCFMKIIRNSCFGGYSLSCKAIIDYLARIGKIDLTVYRRDPYTGVCHNITKHIGEWDSFDLYITVGKLKNTEDLYSDDNQGIEIYNRYSLSDLKYRTDPVLVNVVENLGKEASGKYSHLEVVEIPDDVDWEIEDYDGIETIAEKHRKW